jgi:hypothetical protein
MRVPCHLHPPINFMTQPTNHRPLYFEAHNKKLSWWFCEPNYQTAAVGLESQIGKPADLGFEAKPRNSHSSSHCAWCRPHAASHDFLIVRPPSTQPVLEPPRSSAPSLRLLPRSSSPSAVSHLSPTHHKTSKHFSSRDTNKRVEPPKFPGFKFKPRQVNYSSQIKPRYCPLGFSKSHSTKDT